jgi:hypothetical protein
MMPFSVSGGAARILRRHEDAFDASRREIVAEGTNRSGDAVDPGKVDV